jgi:hypothetical protein
VPSFTLLVILLTTFLLLRTAVRSSCGITCFMRKKPPCNSTNIKFWPKLVSFTLTDSSRLSLLLGRFSSFTVLTSTAPNNTRIAIVNRVREKEFDSTKLHAELWKNFWFQEAFLKLTCIININRIVIQYLTKDCDITNKWHLGFGCRNEANRVILNFHVSLTQPLDLYGKEIEYDEWKTYNYYYYYYYY